MNYQFIIGSVSCLWQKLILEDTCRIETLHTLPPQSQTLPVPAFLIFPSLHPTVPREHGMKIQYLSSPGIFYMVPRKAFSTNTTGVGFGDATLMRPHVIGHAVLPFETLITDWTLKRFLVRMRELVPVEVVDITEGLATHLAGMVLLNWLAGLLHCLGHRHGCGASTAAWVGSGGRRGNC